MSWPHDAEVASVEADEGGGSDPFGDRDNGGVDGAQWHVGVGGDELGHAGEVVLAELLDHETGWRERAKEPCLCRRSEVALDQKRRLDDDADRDDELIGPVRRQRGAGAVMGVTRVRGCLERPGVNDDHAPSSARRISSARSETSLRPLLPSATKPGSPRSVSPLWP